MAVAVEITFPGPDGLANYKKGLAVMGVASGGPHPDPSCLLHWATEIDGGACVVTDVWKTQAAFESFAAGKLGPVMEEVGIDTPPMKFVDVASFLTAGS